MHLVASEPLPQPICDAMNGGHPITARIWQIADDADYQTVMDFDLTGATVSNYYQNADGHPFDSIEGPLVLARSIDMWEHPDQFISEWN